MRNRRRNPRVRARGLAVHVNADGKRHPCVVENISLGGLFIRTDWLLEPGTEVRIDMVRPGWKKMLQLAARIVSRTDGVTAASEHRTPGMGVEFVSVAGDQRDRIEKLLSELGLKPGADPTVDHDGEDDAKAILQAAGLLDKVRVRSPAPPVPLEPLDPSPPVRGFDLGDDATPTPSPAPPERRAAGQPAADVPRLMMQIQGLILELSEAHDTIREREQQIERLKAELLRLRAVAAKAAPR